MNRILTKTELTEQIARMEFTFEQGRKVHELVARLNDSGRASLSELHDVLFPGRARSTAYDNVMNRLAWINAEAERIQSPMVFQLTPQDQNGERWVQAQVPLDEIGRLPTMDEVLDPFISSNRRIQPDRLSMDSIPDEEPTRFRPDAPSYNPGSTFESPYLDGTLWSADERPWVLLTANTHETNAVIQYFCPGGIRMSPPRNGIPFYELGRITKNGSTDRVLLVRSSDTGPTHAQAIAGVVSAQWNARAVIGVGIACGATPNTQQRGDVLVARSMCDIDAGRIEPDGSNTPRGLEIPASSDLVRMVKATDDVGKQLGLAWPKLTYGCFLSGSKLWDNAEERERLVEQHSVRGPVGIEMEALGLAVASHMYSTDRDLSFSWIIVKAICDFADIEENKNNKEKNQKAAADRAARVVYAMLTQDYPKKPLLRFPPSTGLSRNVSQIPEANTQTLYKTQQLILNASADPGSMKKTDAPITRSGTKRQRPEMEHLGSEVAESTTADRLSSGPAFVRSKTPINLPSKGILSELFTWIEDPQGKPLFVILGEFGMGKTVTCQAFTVEQRRRCEEGRSDWWPLYFDLRNVQVINNRVPSLGDVLLECARLGWRKGRGITEEQIWKWIDQGCVVIFDGLDEVLVKLNRQAGQVFTNQLLSVLDQAENQPRVVISSRLEFFRTLREERNRFTGSERGKKDAAWFEARWLLPLTPDQIRAYLAAALPNMNVDQVQEMISKVHDLDDLAHRPFTLRLIADTVPKIVEWQADGKPVNASTLYREFVRSWLDRDDLKHHIKAEHKMYLAEELAAELWRSGEPRMSVGKLEEWFNTWKKNRPGWDIYDDVGREKLDEDLRNSTFLTREDISANEGAFRFAHTSLREFFLSEYMLRALEENALERWDMKPPSKETYGFLGMSLAEKDEPTRQELLTTMGSWFVGTDRYVNNVILEYRRYAGFDHLPQVTLPLIRPQVESLSVDEARRLLKTMKKGEHLCVGGYSWTLLDKDDKTAFLLCDQIVDYQPYNTERVEVTWQTSTLRTWLNHDFLSTLPQDFQDAMATVDASREELELIKDGKAADRLFPLTLNQVKNYFSENKTRIAHRHDGETWWWWLRSVGASRILASIVFHDGTLSPVDYYVQTARYGVRPALKMNL